jgi:DNA-binding MarR family transcriptional regulator
LPCTLGRSAREGGVISRTRAAAARSAGEELLPVPLLEGVGYLLARAGGRAIRDFNRALQPFGMRSRHYTVLVVAAEEGGRSQRDLSELLGIDPSAVVALVDDLAREDLVRREPHPDDRRTRLVVATDRGRARLEEARALARDVDTSLQEGLTAEERHVLLELLRRIAIE